MRRLSKLIVGAAGAAALMTGTAHGQGAVQVSQSGWQWGNPTPQGNTIRAMDFEAGVGYAVGDAGPAVRPDDGGQTWGRLGTGTSEGLLRGHAVSTGEATA